MKNKYYFVVLFLFPCLVCAYKQPTHIELSKSAVKKSKVAMDATLLSDLGLEGYQFFETFQNPDKPNDQNAKLDIINLIMQGANFEDRVPRSLAHFYDPISDTGLFTSNKSPDWALEDIGDVNSGVDGPQEYSYKDARQYFYLALTSLPGQERSNNWGKTFQTLGQVIHHVQDMSQPEHVRNDPHLPVTDTSWYEDYTDDHKGEAHISGLMSGNSYPIPTFNTARDFWTTRATEASELLRQGIADFTNRNFVSNNTNFDYDAAGLLLSTDYYYPQPVQVVSRNIADADVLGTAGQDLCTKLKSAASNFAPGNCYIDFVETTVTDAYTNTSSTNERASSYSVFNKYLRDYGKTVGIPGVNGTETARGFFTLNSLNYDAAHNYLIPRAVAYSAGLINHFFRGKLQISLPDQGIYGIVDQYTVRNINAKSGFKGFDKIKFKVANTTPSLAGQTNSESMNSGTLEAVIKFHRNTCWQDDLSAEPPAAGIFVQNATTGEYSCRSLQEDIVVSSNKFTISASNALTNTPQEFVFNFPNALPINATDVYLQAVYRGQLGNETDAVVVTTKDISEPTFTMVANFTDYYTDNGNFYLVPDPPTNSNQRPEVVSVAYLIKATSSILKPVSVGFLNKPVGSYGSVAFLTDIGASLPLTNDVELLMKPGNITKGWCSLTGVTIAGWQEQFTPTISATSAFTKVRDSYTQQPHACTSGDGSQPSIDKYVQMGSGSTISPVDITEW